MTTWQPDPTGRHQERLHDGLTWTDQVRDRGVVNTDSAGLGVSANAVTAAPRDRSVRPAATEPALGAQVDGAVPTWPTGERRTDRSRSRRFRPFRAVRNLLAIVGIVMLIAAYSYGHSTEFKVECAAHKLIGLDMGWLKNAICDAEFDIG